MSLIDAALDHVNDLPKRVAQMIVMPIAWPGSGSTQFKQDRVRIKQTNLTQLQRWVQEIGIGGVWIEGGHAAEMLLLIHQLQDWAELPLLIGADLHRGLGYLCPGATTFPPLMGLVNAGEIALDWAREMGRITAREATAIGINWLLGPEMMLVVGNEDREAELIQAFMAGAQSESMVIMVGPLPGYGRLARQEWDRVGSVLHESEPVGGSQRLWLPIPEVELGVWQRAEIQVQKAIAAGAGAIMVAHVQIPSLDPDWPVSVSPVVLTQILREQWQFPGLIVTDALSWGGIEGGDPDDQQAQLASWDASNWIDTSDWIDPSAQIDLSAQIDPLASNPDQVKQAAHRDPQQYLDQAVVQAVLAGADLLLAPPDPEAAIQAICTAVERGILSPQRIEASVTRILQVKLARSQLLHNPHLSDHLKDLILSEPIAKASPLGRLIPSQPPEFRSIEILVNQLQQPDGQICAATMAELSIQIWGREQLPIQPQSGDLNWIGLEETTARDYLPPHAPALAAATAHGVSTLISDRLTPLPLLESALDQATGLMVQWFLPDRSRCGSIDPSSLMCHVLREHREQIRVVVVYGSCEWGLDLWRQLSSTRHPIPWIQCGDRGMAGQGAVMRDLFLSSV